MKINTQLNPYFEIIGLLYGCRNPAFLSKESWIKSAEEHGISGEALYKRFGAIHQNYFSAFQKNVVMEPASELDFFFLDSDDTFIIFFQLVCADHPQWFTSDFNQVPEDTLKLALVNEMSQGGILSAPPSFDELVHILETAGYSSNFCWKLMLLMQSPKEKIKQLTDAVLKNIPAYKKAVEAVKAPLQKLLTAFPKGDYISMSLNLEQVVLTPVLVYPASELIDTSEYSHNAYIGLFAKDVYQMLDQSKASRKDLLPALKALSDSSKFEILQSLMVSPKYNLELAEALQLSAATVSHHMSVLLASRLVTVEKKDGKVYYTVAKGAIKNLIEELQMIFSV